MLRILFFALLCFGEYSFATDYSVTVPSNIYYGFPFTVSWQAPQGHSSSDSIRLYGGTYFEGNLLYVQQITYSYLNSAATSGTATFTITSNTNGMGYFCAYYSSSSGKVVALSTDFFVQVSGFSVELITQNPAVYVNFALYWTSLSSYSSDSIKLYRVSDQTSSSQVGRIYLPTGMQNGTVTFSVASSGTYFAVYTASSEGTTATSPQFQVTAQDFSVTVDKQVPIATDFSVLWNAPPDHSQSDNVVLYKGSSGQGGKSVGSAGYDAGSVTFSVSYPGYYTVYYRTSDGEITASQEFEAVAVGYSLSTPESVGIYQTFSVSWNAPMDHSTSDQICLYQNTSYGVLSSVGCNTVQSGGFDEGTSDFSVNIPGTYLLKYLLLDSEVVAQSKYFDISVIGYSIQAPSTASANVPLNITWKAPSAHSVSDSINLYKAADSVVSFISSQSVSKGGYPTGIQSWTISQPGTYYFSYYLSSAGEDIFTTSSISVTASGYTVNAPTSAQVQKSFTVSWSAPSAHSTSDSIYLFQYSPDLQSYLFVTEQSVARGGYSTGNVTFTASTSGNYLCSYYLYGYGITSTSDQFSVTGVTVN